MVNIFLFRVNPKITIHFKIVGKILTVHFEHSSLSLYLKISSRDKNWLKLGGWFSLAPEFSFHFYKNGVDSISPDIIKGR